MAEPSLSMNFEELKSQVGFHLYGGTLVVSGTSTFDGLDDGEKNIVKSVVRSGLRGFYNPPPIRQRKAHKWSFLDKTDNLVLGAPITAGTVEFNNDGSHVADFDTDHGLDEDTAPKYKLELNGISYPIESRHDANSLKLYSDDNPGVVVDETTYRLHQDDTPLPDDFGRLIAPLTYVEKENAWHSVEIVGEGRIRELRQRDNIVNNGSKPQFAAIRTKNRGIESGTRREIMLWPAVSGAYVLRMQYRQRPQDNLDDAQIPYGGTDHAETILYSCLAEAERRLDESRGVYYARFIESLASSIDLDSRTGKARSLGYNGDGSDIGSVFGRDYLFGSRIRHKNFLGSFTD
tara:strand:- start:658 stop:1698 length:1041 start_codon:yes stop_codon:yes gene_type:complete